VRGRHGRLRAHPPVSDPFGAAPSGVGGAGCRSSGASGRWHGALAAAALLLGLSGCRVELGPPGGAHTTERTAGAGAVTEVWVYTSMYQEVLDAMTPDLARALPDVRVQWFQAGSEKVAQRWEAEEEAGGSRACVLATSDPAWYADLAGRGALRVRVPPRALELPRAWAHPTHAAFRVSLMVLAANGPVPARIEELSDPRWKGFSTPDPLSSGTMFTTLATLDAALGADWLARAHANGWVAAGGNSAVLARMQSGEAPVGLVLLENLLAQEGYAPDDTTPGLARPNLAAGAVAIPGYAAVPSRCAAPEAADRVVDWLLSSEAQAHVVRGRMHSPFPATPGDDAARAPAGAPPLETLTLLATPPDAQVAATAPALRARWGALTGAR
jgi:iron(III) transport system substrate-binding protein